MKDHIKLIAGEKMLVEVEINEDEVKSNQEMIGVVLRWSHGKTMRISVPIECIQDPGEM